MKKKSKKYLVPEITKNYCIVERGFSLSTDLWSGMENIGGEAEEGEW